MRKLLKIIVMGLMLNTFVFCRVFADDLPEIRVDPPLHHSLGEVIFREPRF